PRDVSIRTSRELEARCGEAKGAGPYSPWAIAQRGVVRSRVATRISRQWAWHEAPRNPCEAGGRGAHQRIEPPLGNPGRFRWPQGWPRHSLPRRETLADLPLAFVERLPPDLILTNFIGAVTGERGQIAHSN